MLAGAFLPSGVGTWGGDWGRMEEENEMMVQEATIFIYGYGKGGLFPIARFSNKASRMFRNG